MKKKSVIEEVANRLGATLEEYDDDPAGQAVIEFADDYCYSVPLRLSRDDAFAFELQLKDLYQHERDFRTKWGTK